MATCTCALGEDFEGNPVPADTAFFTQAGQCNEDGTDYCKNHPIALPLGGIDDLSATDMLRLPVRERPVGKPVSERPVGRPPRGPSRGGQED